MGSLVRRWNDMYILYVVFQGLGGGRCLCSSVLVSKAARDYCVTYVEYLIAENF